MGNDTGSMETTGGFTALVKLKVDLDQDARDLDHLITEVDDVLLYDIADVTWAPVPYLEPEQCCCGHSFDACPYDNEDYAGSIQDGHASTMCRNCVVSWSCDWDIQLPNLAT